jgi:thiamine biosynthesis protein ThiS
LKEPSDFHPVDPVYREKGMNITLNGEKKTVPEGITVFGLLEFLNIRQERVAVELNLVIVKKNVYAATAIKEGDSLEVVSFMQGGAPQYIQN